MIKKVRVLDSNISTINEAKAVVEDKKVLVLVDGEASTTVDVQYSKRKFKLF